MPWTGKEPQDYRVSAPHFVARLTVTGSTVTEAAPILHWAVGRPWEEVRTYFTHRRWSHIPLPRPPKPTWLPTPDHDPTGGL